MSRSRSRLKRSRAHPCLINYLASDSEIKCSLVGALDLRGRPEMDGRHMVHGYWQFLRIGDRQNEINSFCEFYVMDTNRR